MGVPDRGQPGERGVVGHELGVRAGDMIEGGRALAGVPDEHGTEIRRRDLDAFARWPAVV